MAADEELSRQQKALGFRAFKSPVALDAHFETDRFNEFCEKHLSHLDEVAYEFFAGDRAHEAVRLKVESLFPKHFIVCLARPDGYMGVADFYDLDEDMKPVPDESRPVLEGHLERARERGSP